MTTVTHNLRRAGWFLVLLAIGSNPNAHASNQLLDDHAITIHSTREIAEKRRALINYLWGDQGFPSRRLPDLVLTNRPSPVAQLDGLARVEELTIDLAPGMRGLAYHFVPSKPNHELVVVHHGHGCTMNDDPGPKDVGFGLQRTIRALLNHGYGVLGVFMPHMRPGDCTGAHDAMFDTYTNGSPIRYFLEPTLVSLNYLETQSRAHQFPRYRRFHMIGLSGGGWTTTVYAAIDPRIRHSFSVAGTIPLYLRSGGSVGDREQYEPSFYRIAGYPDLYILGSEGRGRKQTQIVIRADDCCFGQAQHNATATGLAYDAAMHEFADRVTQAITLLGGPGSFRFVIDETAPSHMISHYVIEKVLLPDLLGEP